jgi:hypothetical protein
MTGRKWAIEPHVLQAAAPHGVVRAADLEELGVPQPTIYRRCRANGPWRRLLPGVILLSNGEPTATQLVAAALVFGGPGSMVTGLWAGRRYGISPGPAPDSVHLLVPMGRQIRAAGFVVPERTIRLPEPVPRDGLALAPPVRACLDAARRLRDPREVTELLSAALRQGLCSLGELVTELSVGSQRGSATPRRVLAELGAGVRSAAELDARALWATTGLPEPWWNATVYNASHKLVAVVDAWFDDVALAWEIESIEHHAGAIDFARTMRRTSRLVAEGAVVLPTVPTQLRRGERAAVARQLVDAYRSAAARPRPPLRATRGTSTPQVPKPRPAPGNQRGVTNAG